MNETAVVPIQETVALPISVEEAVSQWQQYQELTRRLLNETDYQKIGNRQFKKKSAWRKYARAFNISDRVTFEEIQRDADGFPIWARIRVEASHPSGRTAEADHECHVKERCCPAAMGLACEKRTWRGHTCCAAGCGGRIHWSHPGDVPATALTRAKNRAISDLIGAGEVSAEEMEGQRHIEEDDAIEGEVVQRPAVNGTDELATQQQRNALLALGKKLGMDMVATQKDVAETAGMPWQELTKAKASEVIQIYQKELRPQ